MEQHSIFSEQDAEAVLAKHQHKVTRQRVGVLVLLMSKRKAFTLKQMENALMGTIDRVTAYRALKLFLTSGIIGRAMNTEGTMSFFYMGHFSEHKYTQFYLECTGCQRVYGLPALPSQYLNMLSNHKVSLLPSLLKGRCSNRDCGIQTVPNQLS